MIFHGDLNYQGHGDLKSDLQPSFHLKYQSICYTTQFRKTCMLLPQFANSFSIYCLNKLTVSTQQHIYIYIYDLVPKGAHARGYALQLKIKHCWKPFLFKMLCCVLACMNEYIVQIISATRLWSISRYSHHTLKKRRKMTAKNGHPCTGWFSSLCLQTNRKHMENQSLICTRKTSFYTDNITSTLTIVVFSINWSRMFALYVRQMCCKLKTLNNRKTTASLRNHRKRRVCSDPCICTTQWYSFFSAKFCTKSEEKWHLPAPKIWNLFFILSQVQREEFHYDKAISCKS